MNLLTISYRHRLSSNTKTSLAIHDPVINISTQNVFKALLNIPNSAAGFDGINDNIFRQLALPSVIPFHIIAQYR